MHYIKVLRAREFLEGGGDKKSMVAIQKRTGHGGLEGIFGLKREIGW